MNYENLLLTLLDKPIVFHRPFLRIMNTNCALFLSQCLHWQRHTKYDGWFAHTIQQFEFETGLSTDEQRTIKKTLKNKGILKIERRGNPCKNWYTIDLEVLYTLLEKQVEKSTNKEWENPTSSNGKIPYQEKGKSHNYINKEVLINNNNKVKTNSINTITKKKSNHYQLILESWNTFAKSNGLSEIRQLTTKRINGIKSRQKENGFNLQEIYDCIQASPFLLGINGNDWKADFDWVFCSPNNWLKIVEGKYKGEKKQEPQDKLQSIFEELTGGNK